MIVVIDIGNSRMKILIENEKYSFFHHENSIEKLSVLFEKYKSSELSIGFSSVNTVIEIQLIQFLKFKGIRYITSKELIISQKIIDCSKVQGIGDDRVFGLIGALEYCTAPLITIDCGTAVTINALDSSNTCLGGVIFPGPFTQLKALSANAEALFETDLVITENVLAVNTLDAINNGILYGVSGAIKSIVELIRVDSKEDFKNIILTGGGGELLKKPLSKLRLEFVFVEDLVLKGVRKVLESVCEI